MKKLRTSTPDVDLSTANECESTIGSGDNASQVKGVAETVFTGTTGIRIFALCIGLFGLARLIGFLIGYSSI